MLMHTTQKTRRLGALVAGVAFAVALPMVFFFLGFFTRQWPNNELAALAVFSAIAGLTGGLLWRGVIPPARIAKGAFVGVCSAFFGIVSMPFSYAAMPLNGFIYGLECAIGIFSHFGWAIFLGFAIVGILIAKLQKNSLAESSTS